MSFLFFSCLGFTRILSLVFIRVILGSHIQYIQTVSLMKVYFRTIHESDLQESLINGDIPNLTVSYTVGFLYFFEQDWLLSKDSVPMNEMQLHDIHLGLKSFRYNVLNLLAQENFSMEGKNYLVEMVNRIDSLEDRLHLLTSQSYVRSDLNREFNHVYGEIFSLLNFYITFYENIMNGEFTPVN